MTTEEGDLLLAVGLGAFFGALLLFLTSCSCSAHHLSSEPNDPEPTPIPSISVDERFDQIESRQQRLEQSLKSLLEVKHKK